MKQEVGNVREAILQEVARLFEEEKLPATTISDDDVLLDTGLDSLAFAVLITRLEDRFGCDPFTEMDEPVYPQTFGELVGIYATFLATT